MNEASTGISAPRQPPGNLGRATAAGFAWAFGSLLVQLGMQLVSFSVLSRLLSPSQYGVVIAAGLVIDFLTLVGQLGIGPTLVQKTVLTRLDVVSGLYFSLALGLILAAVVAVGASALGVVVGLTDDRILQVLAIVLPLQSLAVVSGALARRDLRFKALAVADVVSYGGAYLIVGIVSAEYGAGPWALVRASLAANALDAMLYYAIARHALRPERPKVMWQNVRSMLVFGANVSFGQIGNWIARNIDNLIVVHALGVGPLAIYSRAYQLLSQPATMIGGAADSVLFPTLSRIQSDRPRLARAYVRASSCIAFVMVPATVLLVVLAPEIVGLLLGPKWAGVAGPLRAFAVVLVPRTAYKISDSLTRATGAVFGDAWRQWLYASEVAVGAGVGQLWGTTGVAVGASAAIAAHFVVLLAFSARIGQSLMRQVGLVYAKYVLVGVVVGGACVPVAQATEHMGDAPAIALTTAAALAAAFVVAGALRRQFDSELELVGAALRGLTRGMRVAARAS